MLFPNLNETLLIAEIMSSSYLYGIASGKLQPFVDDQAIASNQSAALEFQTRLSNFWLLDDPDGKWGPISARSLSVFKSFRGIIESGLGKATATALINTDPASLIRGYTLDGSWASKALMWYVYHNFYINTQPGEINICYFRGLNRDGSWNGNEPFVFNDRRVVWRVRQKGNALVPEFLGNWLASCDPGEYYWDNPMNEKGCADIKAWQYKAWSVGDHNGQNALVQTGTITVLRGSDRVPDSGDDFAVDQHSVGEGEDYSFGDDIGLWSAGCMVGASRQEHDEEFMPLVQSVPQEKANPRVYQHWTAVINGNDFLSLFPG